MGQSGQLRILGMQLADGRYVRGHHRQSSLVKAEELVQSNAELLVRLVRASKDVNMETGSYSDGRSSYRTTGEDSRTRKLTMHTVVNCDVCELVKQL